MNKISKAKELFESLRGTSMIEDEVVGGASHESYEKSITIAENLASKSEKLITLLGRAEKAYQTKNDAVLASVQTAADCSCKLSKDVHTLAQLGETIQTDLKSISTALAEQEEISSQMLREAVKEVPMENCVSEMLGYITKIKWDIAACNGSVVKGTFVSKSELKSFEFDIKDQGSYAVQEKLWSMMKEGDKFASVLGLEC